MHSSTLPSRSADGRRLAQLPKRRATELVGEVVGGWRLLRPLGEGGTAVVLAAEHVDTKAVAAVKVMSWHLLCRPDMVQRFEREAHVMSTLGNRHIARVMQWGTTDMGEPFMAMELLVGESLALRLDREGPACVEVVVGITTQLASALATAHAAGIVHRDVKPSNVMLLGDRDELFVKLLDFGISKSLGARYPITADGDILGTPDYMAPEQARGAPVDHHADQFALAALAYELASGQQPFYAEDALQCIHRILYDEAVPLNDVAPGIPAAVGRVIARALSKRPEDRWQSITHFAAGLRAAAGFARDGSTVAAKPLAATRDTAPSSYFLGPAVHW